jgi:hypothetical protein
MSLTLYISKASRTIYPIGQELLHVTSSTHCHTYRGGRRFDQAPVVVPPCVQTLCSFPSEILWNLYITRHRDSGSIRRYTNGETAKCIAPRLSLQQGKPTVFSLVSGRSHYCQSA